MADVHAGDPVSLTGTGVDSDGDPLTFTSTQVSGPTVTLTGASSATVGFVAPEAGSLVRLELVVRDAAADSAPASVEVTVAAAPIEEVPPTPKPQGCGCTSGDPMLILLGLLVVGRRR